MKTLRITSLAMAAAVLAGGCTTPSGQPDRTATGALAGGMIGAGTGALIGNAAGHHTAEGAAIGGILGLVTGAVIGNSMDQQQRAALSRQNPQTLQRVEQGQPLGLADIKALAKAGVSDEVILSQIRNSHTAYRLTTAEILDLKEAGVSEKVIDFMINTPNLARVSPPPAGYQSEVSPPPMPDEVVVSPGPEYVWIPGCWEWNGWRWVWVRGHWGYPPYRGAVWVGGYWGHRGGGRYWVSGRWR